MSSRKRSVSENIFPDLTLKSDTTKLAKQTKETAKQVTFESNQRGNQGSSSKINTDTLDKQLAASKNVFENEQEKHNIR